MIHTPLRKKCFSILILLLLHAIVFSQTLKPGVLVIGASPSGIAAAIQAAHSGVKTVLLDEGSMASVELNKSDRENPYGIPKELLNKIEALQKYPVKTNQTLSPEYLGVVLKGWTDTIKNLTVIRNAVIVSVKKAGKDWDIQLPKNSIKADVIVDATSGRRIAGLVGLRDSAKSTDSLTYAYQVYRTSVAIPAAPSTFPATIPLKFFLSSFKNFVYASPDTSDDRQTYAAGQAAGAIAAYCAFFKTTTDKVNVRLTQSELITYKSRLIEFADVAALDSNALAFQQLALTGIIKGNVLNEEIYLHPDSSISTEDIRNAVKEYYSRSQIWFLDNKSDKITLGQLLSLIKFTAQRGAELDKEVEKGWKVSFKLPGSFDLKRPVTRREFTVLFNSYLRPFDISVDLNGQLKR